MRTSFDPKEAHRQHRARRRAERARIHEGQRAGDDRYLPARDRGPVRRFVRDLVDGRRSPGEYFLYTAAAMLGISLIDAPVARAVSTLALFGLALAALIDSVVLSRRLRRQLAERFPDESTKGAVAYGVVRSLQVRRLRLPAARVSPQESFLSRWKRQRTEGKDRSHDGKGTSHTRD